MRPKKLSRFSKIWLKKIKKKVKLILPICLAAVLVVGLIIFLKSSFWAVKKISCRYQDSFCPNDIFDELRDSIIGKNIIFLSSQKLSSQFLAKHPDIRGIKIFKKIPDEIKAEFKKREAKTALAYKQEFFLIDEEGIFLEKTTKTDLPLILLDSGLDKEQNLRIGQKIENKEILTASKILADLKLNLFEPQLAKINNFNVEIQLKDGPQVVFSTVKELEFQFNSLLLIFSRAKIEGKKIKRLDLRFEKPVLAYE